MCGLIGGHVAPARMEKALASIAHRGPDAAAAALVGPWSLGHTRLAVQDLTSASSQPFVAGRTTVTYNGELWQPVKARSLLPGHAWATDGDTEIVAALLDVHGVEALRHLDGMFALAWTAGEDLYLARDTYGEVPLHYGRGSDGRFLYASEVHPLLQLGAVAQTIRWVEPGSWLRVDPDGRISSGQWARLPDLTPLAVSLDVAACEVRDRLRRGTVGRLTADVPVALLLSGGLDSSAVAAFVRQAQPESRLVGYTAVHYAKSTDLRCARQMAEEAGIELIEVPVPQPTSQDLTDTVCAIEQPHKAQVEIAWACRCLAQRISADGFRVVLSGEGSDEMFASYGSSYHGVKQRGWHRFRAETFLGQHRKNFARTNKVFMAAGVEARLPFLQPELVRYVLQLPQSAVVSGRHPKAVLSEAVTGLVPDEIRNRAKVAFQTGARLDQAAAKAVADPLAFYRAVYGRAFRGVTP